jgi:hypothetical protein
MVRTFGDAISLAGENNEFFCRCLKLDFEGHDIKDFARQALGGSLSGAAISGFQTFRLHNERYNSLL